MGDPTAGDPLGTYRAKRDFERTPEPAGEESRRAEGAGLEFVVQKHAARRLHYDVRFESDGVLVSWAVPKGPSYDPRTKRLAVHVEDHPLDYQHFEGTIPRGEYGAGAVVVWDRGTYRNLTEHRGQPVAFADAVRRGHVSVWLEGEKLRGGWALTRTGTSGRGQDAWIMVKRSDETADPARDVTAAQPDSVLSGRSIEQVAAGAAEGPQWTGGRATWQPPMLAQAATLDDLTRRPPPEGWVLERKLDGLRTVAVRNGDEVELWSRNHLSFTRRFPAIVAALRALPADNFTLDGEVVAFDGELTSFGTLQRGGSSEAVYCVFDVVHLLGRDTTVLPLEDRKRLLAKVLDGAGPVVRPVAPLDGDVARLSEAAQASGWEGLMAKRAGSTYQSGRSADWRKLKWTAEEDLVVGGWTDPAGTRQGFGALLLGSYDRDGGLRFAGKVGTGFDEATLRDLSARLAALEITESPFAERVRVKGSHWTRPELVATVAFSEWTADGRLRHPRFVALRPDKDPGEIRLPEGVSPLD